MLEKLARLDRQLTEARRDLEANVKRRGRLAADWKKAEADEDRLWDSRIPKMVQAYFEDMKRILGHLYLRAEANAQVWLIVSTSAYGGVDIPVDLILADIGAQSGWLLREVEGTASRFQVAGKRGGFTTARMIAPTERRHHRSR